MSVTITKIYDKSTLPNDVDMIGPDLCLDCGYDGEFPQEWFIIDPPMKTKKEIRNATDLLYRQEGYTCFDTQVWQKGRLASASRCPKCGSECLEEGF